MQKILKKIHAFRFIYIKAGKKLLEELRINCSLNTNKFANCLKHLKVSRTSILCASFQTFSYIFFPTIK
jgi:hypothetical protein